MKMKLISMIFGALLSLGATQGAFAGSPLAEVISSGGFVVGGPGYSSGIRVQDDGRVIAIRGNQKKTIALLSRERVQALINSINALESSPLKRDNPNAPICMDAPSTVYSVFQANGSKLDIKSVVNCQPSHPTKGWDSNLEEILDGFKALSYLQKP